ncbi:Heparinase II/III-like protein [Opitutaceae bacterium TAV1]|nr:Heparinase II/III-like protein [Opitutaceae bacterium TAV1]
MTIRHLPLLFLLFLLLFGESARSTPLASVSASVLPPSPRTFVTSAQRDAFRSWCTTGDGAASFAAMRAEFDATLLNLPLPPEPQPYGKPYPQAKTNEAVRAWRAAQIDASRITSTAEAATLIWLVTGSAPHLEKAKAALQAAARWSPDGAAGIAYNDEAAFRLWRKIPFVYDQLRSTLTPDERATLLPALRAWGAAIHHHVYTKTQKTIRNSIAVTPSSHPVRFVSMDGIAGLALLDDLPEARQWFDYALNWYRTQFPPWGGDDGGWSEGPRYWETGVVSEPVRFQDALHQIGHPDAWDRNNPRSFWRQTGYYGACVLQPYPATSFGDISMNGKVRLDWKNVRFLQKLARIFDDGHLAAFAALGQSPPATFPLAAGSYPTGMEHLLSAFADTALPLPPPADLSTLPPVRWFRDIGWVVMHSSPGRPDDDIMLTFLSSPYGSFSHSHAAQNAFILSAYGEELAVNAGYREYHGSPHHDRYTRNTLSKNALLIGGRGQAPKSRTSTGKILCLDTTQPRLIRTTGDATAAYNDQRPSADPLVETVRRDIVFVDRRYFIIRDTVHLAPPHAALPVQWLLHAERPITWDEATQAATLTNNKARLFVALRSPEGSLDGKVENTWPTPPSAGFLHSQKIATQSHFTAATTGNSGSVRTIVAILWPDRILSDDTHPGDLSFDLSRPAAGSGTALRITRPDGSTDRVIFTGDNVRIE